MAVDGIADANLIDSVGLLTLVLRRPVLAGGVVGRSLITETLT
jgi:hypothetical protein